VQQKGKLQLGPHSLEGRVTVEVVYLRGKNPRGDKVPAFRENPISSPGGEQQKRGEEGGRGLSPKEKGKGAVSIAE